MNTYRGIPVTSRGDIVLITEEAIRLKAPPMQICCMRINKETQISGKSLSRGIKATIRDEDTDLDNMQVLIRAENIEYSEAGTGMRKGFRVEPEMPIGADLTIGNTTIYVAIKEISTGGVGIMTNANGIVGKVFKYGRSARLRFKIPATKTSSEMWINCDCDLKNIRNFGGSCQIGIRAHWRDHLGTIQSFIEERKNVLLNELKRKISNSDLLSMLMLLLL